MYLQRSQAAPWKGLRQRDLVQGLRLLRTVLPDQRAGHCPRSYNAKGYHPPDSQESRELPRLQLLRVDLSRVRHFRLERDDAERERQEDDVRRSQPIPKGVDSGPHFMDGDHALAEGALAAGCRFFAGYPITPSTETARALRRALLPKSAAMFIQMEDELASIAAIIGAAWGGQKVMTVTCGPGFSLMMENIGLAAMTETPMVICNVQRGGPSTGAAHADRAAGHDAGALRPARRQRHHRAVARIQPAGVLRPRHRGLQPVRVLPRAGHHPDRRDRRPHAREGGDSAGRPDQGRAAQQLQRPEGRFPSLQVQRPGRSSDGRVPATATVSTSPA